MTATEKREPDRSFEYLLNAFEQSAISAQPSLNGYAKKLGAVFNYVEKILSQRDEERRERLYARIRTDRIYELILQRTKSAEAELAKLRAELAVRDARIDALMLEYCPDEMTKEQIENWCKHQRAITHAEAVRIDAALSARKLAQ